MTKWHEYLLFTQAYPFIIGLIFSQTLADNTLVIVLNTYLKEEWNQSLRLAAAIVNFREFFTDVLKVYVSYLSDEYIGRFPAVVGLTGCYTSGLLMLWVLEAHNSHNVTMLYMALFFISLGKAGDVSLKLFISDQLKVKEPSENVDERRVDKRAENWHGIPWILAAIIASFLNASWGAYSILLTIILGVELLGFWLGKPLYAYEFKDTESAWKKIYYVGKAAIQKRHLPYPSSARGFYENSKDHKPLSPNIYFFRWLDKAAMVDHSPYLGVQEQVDMKRLFTVAEVEEVKYISKILLSYPTLLIYSIIEAAGTTLFFNQANEINKDFPVIRLYIIKTITSYCATILWSNHRVKKLNLKILIGVVCTVLCTTIAWRVEIYRKHVLEQDHFTISIWWLTPQFIFLGLMEGLLKDGIVGLFKEMVSESMGVSGTNLVQFMIGSGKLLSVLFVLKFGSGIDEDNRLGRYYYGFLGATSVVNASISGPILYNYFKDVPPSPQATPASSSPSTTPSPPSSPKKPRRTPTKSPLRTPTQSPPKPPRTPKKYKDCNSILEEEIQCGPSPRGCGGSPNSSWVVKEEPLYGCPTHKECGGSCGEGTTQEIYLDCNRDCCLFSGTQHQQPIFDCNPPIPDWSCIPYSERTSSIFPPCSCGRDCHNNPPVTCTPWIVIDDCPPDPRVNFHTWGL